MIQNLLPLIRKCQRFKSADSGSMWLIELGLLLFSNCVLSGVYGVFVPLFALLAFAKIVSCRRARPPVSQENTMSKNCCLLIWLNATKLTSNGRGCMWWQWIQMTINDKWRKSIHERNKKLKNEMWCSIRKRIIIFLFMSTCDLVIFITFILQPYHQCPTAIHIMTSSHRHISLTSGETHAPIVVVGSFACTLACYFADTTLIIIVVFQKPHWGPAMFTQVVLIIGMQCLQTLRRCSTNDIVINAQIWHTPFGQLMSIV